MDAGQKILGRFILGLLALSVTGCITVTRHGDATLYDLPNIVFDFVDPLVFPKCSLGRSATFSYRVLDLPQEIYPSYFYLEIPQKEDVDWVHNQPWRNCVIRASLVRLNGDVFFTKKIDFSKDWNGSSIPGSDSDYRQITLPFTDYEFYESKSSLPEHRSYILRIEIIRPSLRPTDKLEIDAPAALPHPK
jgi:hypothetical protein